MTKFYVSGAGKSGWSIPDQSHIKSMMAANCHDRYYRVLVTGFQTEDVVTALYIDIGTSAEIAIRDLRWLKKEFLSLPVQSVSARLWGIREEEGCEIEARNRLQEMTQDGNIDGFAVTLIEVPPLPRRVYTGAMENDTRPAIILQHIHSAFSLAVELRLQGLVTYSRVDFENKGVGSKGVIDDDVPLRPEEALQMCAKLQKSINQAFISLYRVLICPKVFKPKLLDSKILPIVSVDVESPTELTEELITKQVVLATKEQEIVDRNESKESVTDWVVEDRFSMKPLLGNRVQVPASNCSDPDNVKSLQISSSNIIDIDSEDEEDEEDLLLFTNKQPVKTKVVKPKLIKIANINEGPASDADVRNSTTRVKKPMLTKTVPTKSSMGLETAMEVRNHKPSVSSDEEISTSISSDSGVFADNTKLIAGGPTVVTAKARSVKKKSSVCHFKKVGRCSLDH